jgi:hypothetical protein
LLASQLRSERSPRRSDSCRLIQYTSRGLPVSPLGFEPKARRFDSWLVFHPAEPELVGPCRTEVETEVVSAVRARESRLARRRCELRSRVPHEDAVSATSKLAQWVERRLRSRLSWVRLPHLRQPVKQASERARGFRPASRCPSGDADQLLWPARVRWLRSSDRSARSGLSGQGARRRKRAAMNLNLARTRTSGWC